MTSPYRTAPSWAVGAFLLHIGSRRFAFLVIEALIPVSIKLRHQFQFGLSRLAGPLGTAIERRWRQRADKIAGGLRVN